MKKKRILFVSDSSRLGGGTNHFLLSLIRYLRNDFECAVTSERLYSQLPDALSHLGVPHFPLRDRVAIFYPALLALIIQGRYDLIYGNGANGRSLWAFRAARFLQRPFIWHVHEPIKRGMYSHGLELADAVIANSRDTAERVRKLAITTKPIVIPCGIDALAFEIDKQSSRERLSSMLCLNPDWFRIINIGRFHRDKNQMDVLRVAPKILEKYPNTYFILVGIISEPDYFHILKREVKQRGLTRNVIFHEYTSDVNVFLRGSDLLLHTAENEPQGLVILEAMAARLPVVAYNVGGVGESIIDQETGFLLPYGDVDGLLRSVCDLIAHPTKRMLFGEAGSLRVKESYSAENAAQAIKEVINQVLWKD